MELNQAENHIRMQKACCWCSNLGGAEGNLTFWTLWKFLVLLGPQCQISQMQSYTCAEIWSPCVSQAFPALVLRCQPLLKHWTMALSPLTYTALPIVLLLLSIHLNTLFFIHLWSPVVLVPLSANGTEKKDAGNRLCFHICDRNLSFSVPERDFHFSILWNLLVLPLVKRWPLQVNITHVFKINIAYYSFCNCVSLSLSPS
nr:uncharacterized protein LOC110364576 [Columba livia]